MAEHRVYQLEFIKKVHLSADIWQFQFGKPNGFEFTAGQFMEYHLPQTKADDRGEQRWFTISAAPSENYLSITTRIFERRSSFKSTLNELEPGKTVEAKGPMGKFVLPSDDHASILIAGGIGATPFRSQIKELLDSSSSKPLTLIYAAKAAEELVFDDIFTQAATHLEQFQYIKIVESAPANWDGRIGKITDELVAEAAGVLRDQLVYVSGPEPMVEAFGPRLEKLGFSAANIKQDWFPNYTDEF